MSEVQTLKEEIIILKDKLSAANYDIEILKNRNKDQIKIYKNDLELLIKIAEYTMNKKMGALSYGAPAIYIILKELMGEKILIKDDLRRFINSFRIEKEVND